MALLYAENEKNYSEDSLSQTDMDIWNVLKDSSNSEYSEILKSDERWEVFYHLSNVRSAALAWYDFKPRSSVLQLGAEFGALTGLLCEKCGRVVVVEESRFYAEGIYNRWKECKNLTIYVQDVLAWEEESKFDYIVLDQFAGRDEMWGISLLKKMLSILKPEGKLLILADNRLGIKYFCGVPEPYSGVPFEGINGYPGKSERKMFSKAQIENIIVNSGLGFYQFFYLLPDRVFTQAVYSDKYLPGNSIRDRIIPYYPENKSLVAVEDTLYDELIDNKMLPQLANSFLIECAMGKNMSKAAFAALSVDRGIEHGFATVVYDNDVVRKKAISKAGEKSLEILCNNLGDLEKRGISVVPHIRESGCVKMPRIKSKNLMSLLDDLVRFDLESFIKIFDDLYQCILRSSEFVDFNKNALYCGQLDADIVGPILNRAYIDMIPYNCFYIDGKYFFYDQEFVKGNYPAKYVLFRALRYSYFYIKDAEEFWPLERFKEKFGLFKLWSYFEAEEARFVEDNRNYDLFSQFYRWADVDKKAVFQNARRLLQKEDIKEKGEGAEIDFVAAPEEKRECEDDLKERKRIGLELLSEFTRVCQKNKLRYCVICGTLLGAIRHNGFIPWDDDIDVLMPRTDFMRLGKLDAQEWKTNYFLQTPENDPGCFYGGYYKLRDSNTTGIEWRNWKHDCNQGLWMDIFPLDYCFENTTLSKYHFKAIRVIQEMVFEKVYPEEKNGYSRGVKSIARIVPHKFLCRLLEFIISLCKEGESEKVAILAQYSKEDQKILFSKSIFDYAIEVPFENIKVPVPVNYDAYLKAKNGVDYMMYPDAEDRRTHHCIFEDSQHSYKTYLDDYSKVFVNLRK